MYKHDVPPKVCVPLRCRGGPRDRENTRPRGRNKRDFFFTQKNGAETRGVGTGKGGLGGTLLLLIVLNTWSQLEEYTHPPTCVCSCTSCPAKPVCCGIDIDGAAFEDYAGQKTAGRVLSNPVWMKAWTPSPSSPRQARAWPSSAWLAPTRYRKTHAISDTTTDVHNIYQVYCTLQS